MDIFNVLYECIYIEKRVVCGTKNNTQKYG